MPWAQGPGLAFRRSRQAPRVETSAATWSSMSMKWVRSFCRTKGRHDMEAVQARLALGMPAACSNPSCATRNNRGSFRVFLFVIAALGALNPARPAYMLIAPRWCPARCIYCSACTSPRLARPIRQDPSRCFAVLRQRLARPTLDSSLCFVCFGDRRPFYAAAGPPDPRVTPPRVLHSKEL